MQYSLRRWLIGLESNAEWWVVGTWCRHLVSRGPGGFELWPLWVWGRGCIRVEPNRQSKRERHGRCLEARLTP